MTDEHMRQSDAFTWYMERDPLLRSTVVSVLILDRRPDADQLLARVDRASRVVPGLRHRLVESPLRLAPPRWVVDPDFDLTYHLRRVEAAPPKTLAGVLDMARTAGMTGFDTARPLWELTLVEGLHGGRAAVVLKTHHSLMDGIGGMQLATSLFDFAREPDDLGPMPDAPAPERFTVAGLVVDGLAYDWVHVFGLARQVVGRAAGEAAQVLRHPGASLVGAWSLAGSIARTVAPVIDTRSPVMTERKLGWHYDVLDVPLEGMKRAAKVAGGTLNDAFLAAVTGGFSRYHLRHDSIVEELRLTMPISIREDDDPAGGNRITLMRFAVPVDIDDPIQRMQVLHDLAEAARREPAIPFTNAIAGTMNLLPRGVVGGMLKHIDFVASNVPGVATPLYLGGARVERFYPFGPTIGAAVNCTLLSYCAQCCIGVNTDVGAVPDPDLLLDCLHESFSEILALTGEDPQVSLPTRRA